MLFLYFVYSTGISIHSLRMEGDCCRRPRRYPDKYFNPLPPHGGRHWIDGFFDKFAKISIHSLRMEGDAYSTMLFSTIKSFQSTPSAWRETHTAEQYDGQENAFQSTPSAWRETSTRLTIYVMSDFNPLPPHGGRPAGSGGITMTITFQSTPSAWRETGQDHGTRLCRSISIHSLRMEGDYIDLGYLCGGVYFNPLPPHGGRHIDLVDGDPAIIISIHSLRMEGDLPCQNLLSAWGHFNPLPPHGGRHFLGLCVPR